jgi:hypothetical protein
VGTIYELTFKRYLIRDISKTGFLIGQETRFLPQLLFSGRDSVKKPGFFLAEVRNPVSLVGAIAHDRIIIDRKAGCSLEALMLRRI